MNSPQNAGNNTEIKPLRRAANYSWGTHSGAFTLSLGASSSLFAKEKLTPSSNQFKAKNHDIVWPSLYQ